jgi:gamma-F420-2:alpha-L-glutamate ligase
MIGWLLYSRQDIEKNKAYIDFYREEGKGLDIDIQLIITEELEFGIKNKAWFITYKNELVKYPDFAICRTIYPLLNKQLEYVGINVFNNSHIAEICNDKAKTYQYVAQLGIPMVDSVFTKNSAVLNSLETAVEPCIIKAVAGHGGSQVFLYNPNSTTDVEKEKSSIYTKLQGADTVVQPLIGTNHQDLRVYIIGDEIIAAVLRTAKEGFKSNFSLGGEVETYTLSDTEVKLVKRIISLFDIGMVGIDFIIGDDSELIFNEIEDVVGARMLYQCTKINLVRLYLEFICNQIKIGV